jgi:hypothetical protein
MDKLINAILRPREFLDIEVLRGIVANDCALQIQRLKHNGNLDRYYIYECWNQLLQGFNGKIFIGFEPCLILENDSISFLLGEMARLDLDLCLFSDCGKIYNFEQPINDALFAVKSEIIKKVPFVYTNESDCPICNWIRRIKAMNYNCGYAGSQILKTVSIGG